MGGKLTNGKRWERRKVEPLVKRLVKELEKQVGGVIIPAGSFGRNCPDVGDIDLFVLPASQESLHRWQMLEFGLQKNGKPAKVGIVDKVQVEIWEATMEDAGGILQFCMGSAELNIALRTIAKQQGLKFSRTLVDQEGSIVAGSVEEISMDAVLNAEKAIWDALGVPWLPFEERSLSLKEAFERLH
jgi:DNA polymerase/3'-5' exonuclease PolX